MKEKNKRLAKSLNGPERPWNERERYQLFVKGFRDGAGMKAMDREASGLGAYDRGYAEGQAARGEAAQRYANEIGYKPDFFRLADSTS